jgi:hypothetical protein
LEKVVDITYPGFDTFSNLLYRISEKPSAEEEPLFNDVIERVLELTYHKSQDYLLHGEMTQQQLACYNLLFFRLECFYNRIGIFLKNCINENIVCMIVDANIEGLSKSLTTLLRQCYIKFVPANIPLIDDAQFIDDVEEPEMNVNIETLDTILPREMIKLLSVPPNFEESTIESILSANMDIQKLLTSELTLSRRLISIKALDYLLGWVILLDKMQYGGRIGNNNYLSYLSILSGVIAKYKVIYTGLLNKLVSYLPQSESKISFKDIADIDISNLSLYSVKDVRFLILHVTYKFMMVFPKLTRNYFSEQTQSIQNKMNAAVTKIISKAIWNEEINSLNTDSLGKECKLHYIKSTREVEAVVVKDEYEIKLDIKLPQNYPLREAEIITNKNEIFSEQQILKWNLAMTKMISEQNSNLEMAIKFWKANLDKKLEGVSQCMICYSIVHSEKRTIPTQECKTCKNKFHAACLKKWITTSHKSKCPFCQNYLW